MGERSWTCRSCTYFNNNEGSGSGSMLHSRRCEMCDSEERHLITPHHHHHHHPSFLYRQHPHPHRTTLSARTLHNLTNINGTSSSFSLSTCTLPRIFAGALSGAVTGMFAVGMCLFSQLLFFALSFFFSLNCNSHFSHRVKFKLLPLSHWHLCLQHTLHGIRHLYTCEYVFANIGFSMIIFV